MTEDEKPIRVVDRRMFTPDGELRPGFQPEEEPAPPGPPAAAPAPAGPREPPPPAKRANPPTAGEKTGRPETPATAAEFLALVEFLASNISAALGYDPLTGQKTGRINATAARQMIEWLGLLEHKTQGNLSFEETDFLARMLYGLRLAYVEATQTPAK
jgi:hypothetical protein